MREENREILSTTREVKYCWMHKQAFHAHLKVRIFSPLCKICHIKSNIKLTKSLLILSFKQECHSNCYLSANI